MAVLEEIEGAIQTAVERTGPAVIGLGPVSYTHLTLPTKA